MQLCLLFITWRVGEHVPFPFVPEFIANTTPSVPDTKFERFMIPSVHSSVVDDEDEMLMCPV